MTACGFCVVAALSSQMSGLPLTFSFRIGKSRRMEATSNWRRTDERSGDTVGSKVWACCGAFGEKGAEGTGCERAPACSRKYSGEAKLSADLARSSLAKAGSAGMFGREASKLGKASSKSGNGRLKGEEYPVGLCRKTSWLGEERGVTVSYNDTVGLTPRAEASAGKPEPERRARSASLGTLSRDGSEGRDGAGAPNWGRCDSDNGSAEEKAAGDC